MNGMLTPNFIWLMYPLTKPGDASGLVNKGKLSTLAKANVVSFTAYPQLFLTVILN
ncbi:MAG: hypothetical protein WAO76_08870 [Georgfuchsia sp.]